MIINNDIVNNKMLCKYRTFLFDRLPFSFKLFGIVFVGIVLEYSVSATSVISSFVITESPIIVSKNLTFSKVMYYDLKCNLFHKDDFLLDLWSHISIFHYSTFDLSYIFYHQI